jgi:group II intron reverse transcriptase/maturase
MSKAMRQKFAKAKRTSVATGEAGGDLARDEACGPQWEIDGTGSALLEAMLARANLQQAWKRVKANKGSAGVDGLDIRQTAEYLKTAWPSIRDQLRQGNYRPSPVRRVAIPKPEGGQRELGIPTVLDRLIQQALLQVLQPVIDPTFSEHSYGFRPGRRAQDAVLKAQTYVQSGKRIVVDVDLEKFFDRVNHDILIDRFSKRVKDQSIIRLVRAYLNADIMSHGVVQARYQGTPQGGPLSPLLANILLDEVDKELQKRGHCFVRYADDCNVYVGSISAGQRVMRLLRRCYNRLKLKVNETKSAVANVIGRKFLGYSFWVGPKATIKRRVADKAMTTFKHRIRQLTRRSHSQSLSEIIARLRRYLLGWKGYFGLAQTPGIWRRLDKWLRHRLRAIQLKQWKRGTTQYRELLALGASAHVARQIAANSRCWWRNSAKLLNSVLTISYFDRLGLPRLL